MKSLTALELEKKVSKEEKLQIIDVREDFEVKTGKIPGAKHIPLGEIPDSLEMLDKKQHYYMVCQSGGRSASACEFLIEQGYEVTNVAGGMMTWQGEIE